MLSRKDVAVRLRSVGNLPRSVGADPGQHAVRLQSDWHRILTDLTSFGLVRVTVANPVAGLECLAEPWSARVADRVAMVEGPGLALVLVPGRLAGATIENGGAFRPDDHVLRLTGWTGTELMRVTLTEESLWSGFHAMLVRQWAQRAAPRPVAEPGVDDLVAALSDVGRLPPARGDRDFADAWYLQRRGVDAAPLANLGQCVDPTLIVPFLEVMAEQACRMRVTVGNAAVLQQHETDFHDCRCESGRVSMRGSTAAWWLHTDGVDAACVIAHREGGRLRRRVRLFDAERRTLVTLAAAADAHDGDPELWRLLVNALLD